MLLHRQFVNVVRVRALSFDAPLLLRVVIDKFLNPQCILKMTALAIYVTFFKTMLTKMLYTSHNLLRSRVWTTSDCIDNRIKLHFAYMLLILFIKGKKHKM